MSRWIVLTVGLWCSPVFAQPANPLVTETQNALKKAIAYYHGTVASHGGYVYYYSHDLNQRWGEGKADKHTLFVQPPGTPTMGMAFLKAYEATNDPAALTAARDAALALVYGQLQSGGWTQTIHFARVNRMGKYRNGKGGNWNNSSLDDGQTQAALLCLMRTDRALGFKDKTIHEATQYGLDALLKAQFANGAFPQIWNKPAESKPILKARFPDYDWKTEGRVKNYWDYYTLNDGLAGDVFEVLKEAHAIYSEDRFKVAIRKLGDFLIAAQMPDPQPGWCQQYNYEMIPIWARKFEPPAISGWESQDAMTTLIRIARFIGENKYLEPIPKALAYLRGCQLSQDQVARFYELKTNKPLYMDARYQLTYDDSNAPTHYGWKQPAHFDRIEKEYQSALKNEPINMAQKQVSESEVRAIIKALDANGRWISTYAGERLTGQPKFASGFPYLSSEVFAKNCERLSYYLLQQKK